MDVDLIRVGRLVGPPVALFAWSVAWWSLFHDGPDVASQMGVLAVACSAPVPFFFIRSVF